MDYFIRVFVTFLLGYYVFMKIFNIQLIAYLKYIYIIILSIILSLIMIYLGNFIPIIRLLIINYIFGISTKIIFSEKLIFNLLTGTISLSISYGAAFCSAMILAIGTRLFLDKINLVIFNIMTIILNIILIFYLFKIKRFRNGFYFVKTNKFSYVGFLISCFIILSITIFGVNQNRDIIIDTIMIIIIVLIIFLFIYWLITSFKKLYISWQNEKNQKEDRELITKLTKSNDYLSKIIHRDNKLLPAMYNAVDICLSELYDIFDNDKRIEVKELHNQIERLINERTNAMMQLQHESKVLPSTNIMLIDTIFKYMLTKSTEKNIQFDLNMRGKMSEIINNIISESNLETLISDLVENAIIATTGCQYKKILITFMEVYGIYELCIQDSGLPFEINVLTNLGIKKCTTHNNEGGSGIGYMATFEILKRINASLLIIEYKSNILIFTKAIKILFDGKNQFIIKSYRCKEIEQLVNRSDLILLESEEE